MANAFAALSKDQRAAAEALVADAGCGEDRARELVTAVEAMGRADALETVAGTANVSGSIVDTRVERLRKLLVSLGPRAELPNAYEVSAIFRITPSQARALLRTYEVRHSSDVRDRMDALVKAATGTELNVKDVKVWRVDFDDPAVMEYAYEKLRRRGLSKSVDRDTAKLQLTVERARKDRHGLDAKQILGFST
jgi:hypothetical protein